MSSDSFGFPWTMGVARGGHGLVAALFASSLTLSACTFSIAGAGGVISAPNTRAPVSMTRYVYDESGNLLGLGEELEGLGWCRDSSTIWSLFWTLLPLSNLDYSETLNRCLDEFGGEAVVGFRVVASSPSGLAVLLSLFTTILPFIPSYSDVEVEGVVVRRISR